MRPFEYVSPTSEQQALGLLGPSWDDAEILAGGTDLIALMKDEVVRPKRLVNIKRMSYLRGVSPDDRGGLQIGALTTIAELSENPQIREMFPAVAQAAGEAASPQIRNLATVGGNLCQRPRCWYFRNGMGLLPRNSDGRSLVLEGDNRCHAILGNDGPAYFVSPSTLAPALIALGARLYISDGSGKIRDVALEKFYRIPKEDGEREHDLRPKELVSRIYVPRAPELSMGAANGSWKAANYEVRQKETFDWPLATCSVALLLDGRTVRAARIVLGHVAPVPWVSSDAARAITGKELTPENAMAAANAALSSAKSLGKNKYKITVAKAAVKRALLAAGGAHDANA